MPYVLTRGEVATQLDAIHARVTEVCAGLDAQQMNWRPEGGRRWSIAQCLDHLAKTTVEYGRRVEEAIDAAPELPERPEAHPGLAGRLLIWSIEPPSRIRVPTKASLRPPATLEPAVVRRAFSDSLDYLSALAAHALRVDAARIRYRNPLIGDLRLFDVVTGVLVILAHNRRHIEQARRIRRHRDFPR